jgi:hypothetical protein
VENKYRSWIIYLSVASLSVGLWLIYSEIVSPGFCPPYPMIGVPTCYLVAGFFLLVIASQFVGHRLTSSFMFQLGAIAGMATAIWFSVNHVLGKLQCPVLFGLPLCFAAFATFLVLITLNQLKCIDQDQCSIERH